MNGAANRAYVASAVVLAAVHLACCFTHESSPATSPLTPARLQLRLNPNTATAAELELLPRIGPTLGQKIVAYRAGVAEQPAFRRAEDLDRVPRIGPATVEAMRPFLLLPEAPEPLSP
jgi:DNA uptake protein ComE-like DNA-binding protein